MNVEDLTEEILKRPIAEQEMMLEMLEELKHAEKRERAEKDFLYFVHQMWPGFVDGRHHKVMAKKFQEIAEGKCKRLIINMPPRHTKSEFASYMLPAWFLGRFPGKKIIQCSNTAELAVGFGRKVRNLVDSEQYAGMFPNVNLRQDSKAAGRWATSGNGEYFAIGVGGTVTGKGADLLIIDDPHSEQEAKLASSNPEVFDNVYEWYTSGPRQRLQPGGAIVIVMCMTGDTPVLMRDGTEKLLRDIKVGDKVATYIDGRIASSRIANWQSSGVDSIYKIQTQSGKILRANNRHPFLVDWKGDRKWARLQDLMVGMDLVSTKVVEGHQNQQRNPDFASGATQTSGTMQKTQTLQDTQWATTVRTRVRNALAASPFMQEVCASFATENSTLHQKEPQNKPEHQESNIATESHQSNTMQWLLKEITGAMYAAKSLAKRILELIGMESFASTIATKQEKSEGSCATTATWPSDMEEHKIISFELQNTYDVILDRIVSIEPDGEEEVFDIEVEHTENFIANGFVSHNTRWSKRDVTGRILQSAMEKEGNDEWEVIEFPAILPSGNPLWPQFWSIEELEALRSELPPAKWNAQYQQSPTSEEGAIVKREWWKIWDAEDPPRCEFVIQSWDTAFTKNERSDYSACTTWGVFYNNDDPNDANVILLDAFKGRYEFPELKDKAFRHYNEWEPDAFIIEAKASGAPLIFELRAMGIPVQEFTPSRGNDKVVRINSVADLFASGKVWAPPTRWAEEVMEEMASFPNSDHDDLVDSSTQALIRFRKGGFIRLASDEPEDQRYFKGRRNRYY